MCFSEFSARSIPEGTPSVNWMPLDARSFVLGSRLKEQMPKAPQFSPTCVDKRQFRMVRM